MKEPDVTHVYIIAEAGVNHNGDIALARQLIEAAHAAGADAVKFQTFKTEKILTKKTGLADYQKKNLRSENSQFQMIKALELSFEDFANLKSCAESIGIDFLSTPDDEDSLDFLADELNLPWIKIGSGEVTNLPFLRRIAAKQKPMILSTGMSTLGEVERVVRLIREINQKELILLHCTTNYPCPPEEVNLRAMLTLQRAFNVRVGYSDHTVGSEVPVAAVALGAEIIEKHLTLNKDMEGPDHRASLDPIEFSEMVRQIRSIEVALGDGVKWPNPSEEKIKPLVRRRIVAAHNLPQGTVIGWNDLSFKRANEGIYVDQVDHLIGRRLNVPLHEDSPLMWSCIGEHIVQAQTTTEIAPSSLNPRDIEHVHGKPTVVDISLNPAIEDDFEFIYKLKCEEGSIYWGGFSAKPDYDRLKYHYAHNQADTTKFTLIIRWLESRVGLISFRVLDGIVCEDYSLNVSQEFSGLGLGVLAVKKSIEYLTMHFPSCEKVVVWIRVDDLRSQKVFKDCDFIRTEVCQSRYLDSDGKAVLSNAWIKLIE